MCPLNQLYAPRHDGREGKIIGPWDVARSTYKRWFKSLFFQYSRVLYEKKLFDVLTWCWVEKQIPEFFWDTLYIERLESERLLIKMHQGDRFLELG